MVKKLPDKRKEILKRKIFNIVKIYRHQDLKQPTAMKGFLNNLADLYLSLLKKQRNLDKQKKSKKLVCDSCKHLMSAHIPDKVYKHKGLSCAYKGCNCKIKSQTEIQMEKETCPCGNPKGQQSMVCNECL